MKYTIAIMGTMLMMAWVVQAQAETPQQYVQKNLYKHGKCLIISTSNEPYCVKHAATKIVTTPKGTLAYVLFMGSPYNPVEDDIETSQASMGLAYMYVLKQLQPNQWQGIGSPNGIESGVQGNEMNSVVFKQFGPDAYGFMGSNGYNGQGFAGGHRLLVSAGSNGVVGVTDIKVLIDSSGYYVEKNPPYTKLKAALSLDNKRDINGRYPINLLVNGVDKPNKKSYKQQKCVALFDANRNTYVLPKDYPIVAD